MKIKKLLSLIQVVQSTNNNNNQKTQLQSPTKYNNHNQHNSSSNKMTSTQNQPEIIQQPYKSTINQQRFSPQQVDKKVLKQRPQTSQMVFFEIMDQVDEYDHLLKEMNQFYTEGMLTIANVKFVNPYTSLSTKGYKPTPAITKVTVRDDRNEKTKEKDKKYEKISEKTLSFKLITQTNDIKFTNSVIDSINTQKQPQKEQNRLNQQNQPQQSQTQSHSAHSSQSTANQLYSYDEEELIIQEEETIEECRKLVKGDNFLKEEFILDRFNIQSQKDIVLEGMNKFGRLLEKLLEIAEKKYYVMNKFDSIKERYQKKEKQVKPNDIK